MDLFLALGLIGVLLVLLPTPLLLLLYVVFYYFGTRYRSIETFGNELDDILSIVIPVRNEPIEYIDEALSELSKWRISDKIEVFIVSDDPEDRLPELIRITRKWRSAGLRLNLIWRRTPKGYKPGALNTALYASRGKYFYVIDVDTRVNERFLVRASRLINTRRDVAAVVARWSGKNRETRISEALSASMKFVVDALYRGRSALGLPVFPVGTGTLYDAELLKKELKGWDENRVQDDMEIGCRIMYKGKQIIFLDDEKVLVGVPNRYRSVRVQQERWAYGATDTAIARLKEILFSPLPWYAKIESLGFLLQYVPAFLTLIGALLLVATSILAPHDYMVSYWYLGLPWFFIVALYIRYYLRSMADEGYDEWRALVNLGRASALTAVLSPIMSYAIIKAMLRIKMEFKRTPKGRHEEIVENIRIPYEALFGLFFFIDGLYMVLSHMVYTGLWMLIYSLGYIYSIIRWGNEMIYR